MSIKAFQQELYQQHTLDNHEINLILCHVLEINTAGLFIYEKPIPSSVKKTIKQLIEERIDGKPLAYITGHKHFWTLDLKVNEHTLIPRPETELIVELILNWTDDNYSGSLLDLGTGSGAIALSLAKHRPKSNIIAVDFSPECVKTAQLNQEKNAIKNVKIWQSDWFSQLENKKFDYIVSNPPYIAENDPHLLALKYEPITALTAKDRGYADLEHIIKNSTTHLNQGGIILLEHGYDQSQKVQELLLQNNYSAIKTHKDLSDIPRITTAQLQNIAINKE
jgi:release factor glutamine methyltransferase